jgi:hypothetical protein
MSFLIYTSLLVYDFPQRGLLHTLKMNNEVQATLMQKGETFIKIARILI